jgi:uncharacterized protein YydD (DUF2326 family)
MIRRVRCDQPTFHDTEFQPGFNVVLAVRNKEETKKQTRNGLGKTTLVEIIHFCLGTDHRRSPLAAKELHGWTFTLDIVLNGNEISVARNTGEPTFILIDGDTSGWPIRPKLHRRHGPALGIREWKEVLGALMFGLPVEQSGKYRPQFRGLIPYFIRTGKDAYSIPFEHHRKQKTVDVQVFNSFLLGLEFQDAADFQLPKVLRSVCWPTSWRLGSSIVAVSVRRANDACTSRLIVL